MPSLAADPADPTQRATPHYRPTYHHTPAAHWMNDPNGLVFHQGVYHLFFQYHPHSSVWGPMHWGHATSTDLLQWQEQAIALRPDALGMIFSGSAVVDAHNSAGLGPAGTRPLVAVFTHHDGVAGQAGGNTHENQSLAYSLDQGLTWTPYAGNPVLKNPGHKDFRDPKVRWLPDRKLWLMSLAVGDHISFYSSPDLKRWTLESDFGVGQGAHDGVWECPDLFPLTLDGRTRWVLLVSLVKGAPNGGSATQYFVGDFDGHRFTAEHRDVRWLDHGPDHYAGVTWSGVDDRALFIAWMSNWDYARDLPTAPWRSAMTMPRELTLRRLNGETRLASEPARELLALQQAPTLSLTGIALAQPLDLSAALKDTSGRLVLRLSTPALRNFTITLGNEAGDSLRIGYEARQQRWWIDRTASGEVGFHPGFAATHHVPRFSAEAGGDLQLWFDTTSVELFADGGLSTLTSLFFPRQPWSRATLTAEDGMTASVSVQPLRDPR